MRRTGAGFAGVLMLTMAMSALPDAGRADCVVGVRNATPEELAFGAKAEAALAAALPAPVPNSERRGGPNDFSRQPRLSFCKGDHERKVPHVKPCSRRWTRSTSRASSVSRCPRSRHRKHGPSEIVRLRLQGN